MEYGYILKISNKNVYKEIQLPVDTQSAKIGMDMSCNVRLYKEDFFESFDITLTNKDGLWQIICSNNIYIDAGDVRKLVSKNLKHGDSFIIKYKESDEKAFDFEFLYDFDNENKDYSRVIDVSNANMITIGGTANSNILLNSNYVKDDSIAIQMNGNGDLVMNISNTKYGVYHNGKKAKNKEIIKNKDFFSIGDFSFYYKNKKLMTQASDNIKTSLTYYDIKMSKRYPKFNRNTRVKSVIDNEKIEILDPPVKPKQQKNRLLTKLLPSLVVLALLVDLIFLFFHYQ